MFCPGGGGGGGGVYSKVVDLEVLVVFLGFEIKFLASLDLWDCLFASSFKHMVYD